jgi:hypothetical protein
MRGLGGLFHGANRLKKILARCSPIGRRVAPRNLERYRGSTLLPQCRLLDHVWQPISLQVKSNNATAQGRNHQCVKTGCDPVAFSLDLRPPTRKVIGIEIGKLSSLLVNPYHPENCLASRCICMGRDLTRGVRHSWPFLLRSIRASSTRLPCETSSISCNTQASICSLRICSLATLRKGVLSLRRIFCSLLPLWVSDNP